MADLSGSTPNWLRGKLPLTKPTSTPTTGSTGRHMSVQTASSTMKPLKMRVRSESIASRGTVLMNAENWKLTFSLANCSYPRNY